MTPSMQQPWKNHAVRAFTLIELIVVLLILAVLLSLLGTSAILDGLVALVAGWWFYLVRVLGEIAINWLGVVTALGCLVLLALGLHGFLGWLYRQSRGTEAPPWRPRWTGIILGVVVLVFVAGIAAVGLSHQTAWLLNSPVPLVRGGRDWQGYSMSQNNLKQFGIALHAQAEQNRDTLLPGCTFDPQGQPLHGWQTLILPYIEQEALFRRIDLSRPWNDPHHAGAMRTEIRIYLNPPLKEKTRDDGYALSHYAGNARLLGAGGPWRMKDITDGLSTTILAGEAAGNYKPWGHPMNWRDPALGLQRGPDGFGGPRKGITLFLLADGSVRSIRSDVSLDVLRAASTPAGKEVINPDDW